MPWNLEGEIARVSIYAKAKGVSSQEALEMDNAFAWLQFMVNFTTQDGASTLF